MKESQTEPCCSPIGPDNKHVAPNGASFRGKKPLLLTQWPLQFMKSVYRTVLSPCTRYKCLAPWPSAGPDYSSRPMSLRVNYSTLRSLVGADRVPPAQFVPVFEVLCLRCWWRWGTGVREAVHPFIHINGEEG